jgi:hypothetical protein
MTFVGAVVAPVYLGRVLAGLLDCRGAAIEVAQIDLILGFWKRQPLRELPDVSGKGDQRLREFSETF